MGALNLTAALLLLEVQSLTAVRSPMVARSLLVALLGALRSMVALRLLAVACGALRHRNRSRYRAQRGGPTATRWLLAKERRAWWRMTEKWVDG